MVGRALAFLAKEWKFLVSFALAVYVAVAVAGALSKFSVSICIGYWGCRH